MKAFWNGQFRSAGEIAMPLHDAGFVQGATVSDVARTYGRRLVRFALHAERFRRSCELCRVPLTHTPVEIEAIALRLIEFNLPETDGELLIVTLATPGPVAFYAVEDVEPRPTFAMTAVPLRLNRFRRLFTEGARLIVPAARPVPATSIDPRAKMRSRMTWWIAEQQARDTDPLAAALLATPDGFVTETASANLLMVRDGRISTPTKEWTLDGLSRGITEELAGRLGVPFEDRPLTLVECQTADEVWLSSASYGLAGVSRLNGVAVPWPGPLLRRFQNAFGDLVGTDLVAQIIASK